MHLLPAFGDYRLEGLTARKIEAWRRERMQAKKLPRRTAIKVVAVMHGICERARRTYCLPENPVADVERIRDLYDPARFDFYTPEEIMAVVRAADWSELGAGSCPTTRVRPVRGSSRTISACWRTPSPPPKR